MPAYNFKKRYWEKILNGTKTQTIRKEPANGWPRTLIQGETIRLYGGMRTRGCRLLKEARVTFITGILITDQAIYLSGPRGGSKRLDHLVLHEFAVRDGFKNAAEMVEFFKEEHGLPFVGRVIGWE